ncbi:mitochondrial inner membrane m-AAA protease component paraplegin isoform X2 [Euwallacea similis]|uniref:mitochondrial inner membrane m-AAA protease component paraplegin isoform X2 n=1 Tax=Euwallacea similis TaxID=1736056 RepID=UPI0034500A01
MYRNLKNGILPLKLILGNPSFSLKASSCASQIPLISSKGIKGELHLGTVSNVVFRKHLKIINREYAAVCALLQRSGFTDVSQLHSYFASKRNFSTSAPKRQKEGPRLPDSNRPDNNDNDDDKDKLSTLVAKALIWMLTAYMFIAIISLMFPSTNQPEVVRYVSWNEFLYQMLAKGEVEQIIVRPDIDIVTIILHEGAIIKGKKSDIRTYHMNIANVEKFETKLREAERRLGIKDGVPVTYERGTDSAGKLLTSLVFVGLLIWYLAKNKAIRAPLNMDVFSQMTRAQFTLVDPLIGQGKGVHFNDVAGLREAKQEIIEFVDYLKRPEHYRSLGAKVPKGALLLGPPGCGKTLLAKAVATEANVPFLSMNGSEFIEMIGGLGAARVRDLFKEARKRAPCIVYIDEIDAVGRKRSGTLGSGASGESEQTLNQLLVEMDGMASKENVIMLASTNRADILDKALLRPGRFDRHILIDYPDLLERNEIFQLHLKGIALEQPPGTYSKRLAFLTPGFSGADIANVCNEAALHAARLKQHKVTGNDLEYAVERLVGGTEKRSHSMSPQEKRVVAYHESGHALVGWMLKHTDALLKVTIVPRTNLALGFAQYVPKDQKLHSREELFDKMCMALGGRVAEALVFNRITTGAQNDLDKVTKMAYANVKEYGMNENVGLVSFPEEDTKELGRRPYSKKFANLIDLEARRLVALAYQHTEEVLNKNRDKLELLAENLLKKETLNYDDVENLFGPPPFGKKKLIDPAEFEETIRKESGDSKETTTEATANMALP